MKRVSYISCYNDSANRSNIAGQSYGGSLRRHPKLIKKLRPQYMHIREKGCLFQQRALMLAGTNDPILPLINARLMARPIRHSKLRVYDDGHPYLLTSPEEGARTLSGFLLAA